MSAPAAGRPALLLADLHLPPAPSPLRDAFRTFLAGPARGAAAVYILGDLFEYWIGDVEGLDAYAAEVTALRALTDAGVPVFYQHGNRDFMVGRRFFAATRVQLLPDPALVTLGGQPTLVSHGDVFCTDDVGYQRWRRFSRQRWSQWVYARLPRAWREGIAGGLRAQSGRKQYGPAAIMDVNAGAIRATLERHPVAARLVHGHTHRPAEHRHEIGARTCERIVLCDWRPGRLEYLRADGSGFARISLPAA